MKGDAMAALIFHGAVWLAVIGVLIAIYYVIRAESAFSAYVYAAGTLVRLVSGGAAFAISYICDSATGWRACSGGGLVGFACGGPVAV